MQSKPEWVGESGTSQKNQNSDGLCLLYFYCTSLAHLTILRHYSLGLYETN
jgi:hypothetical protein